MSEIPTCPRCSAALPPEDTGRICSRCLLEGGLAVPSEDGTEPTVRRSAQLLPERIGPYKIVERLGEGGMGIVYLAQQSRPIRRYVGLKVLKPGMDTSAVLTRFDAERQALALMDHPSIARVYEAGETDRGLPYFAMEFVPGVPITDHCDRQRLSIEERLELFIEVCDAVHHAHQKAIIHRDLKPSNVIVAIQGMRAVPKIIDFGVAKATGHRLTEQTMYTGLGVLIGTPEYMSPEQAEMTSQDVDTRTDVYSLGVLLYELLVGALPVDADRLRCSGLDEIRRQIREGPVSKPSVTVANQGRQANVMAERRRVDSSMLIRRLRGDLDWIVMKALEKDRTRRYGSAQALADDVTRHLRFEPVTAGPPSAAYRLGKFVRRHRVGVAFAATVLVLMVLGIAGTSFGLVRSLRAEAAAKREAETAKRVVALLEELFEFSDPELTGTGEITVREVLDRGASNIERELADEPLLAARLMATIGRVYRNLAEYEQAEAMMQKALEIRQSQLSNGSLAVSESLFDLSSVDLRIGEYDSALEQANRSLGLREALLGSEHFLVGENLARLAEIHGRKNDHATALSLAERALEILEIQSEPDAVEIADVLNLMGIIHLWSGSLESAAEHFRRALELQEEHLAADDHRLAMTLNNLAIYHQNRGDSRSVRALLERALAIWEYRLGVEHPYVGVASNNLGYLLIELGDYTAARPLLARAVAVGEKTAPDSPWLGRYLTSSGLLARLEARYDEAGTHLDRAYDILSESVGRKHSFTAWVLAYKGDLARDVGEYDQAERWYEEAHRILTEVSGPAHWETLCIASGLAEIYRIRGRHARSLDLFERTLEAQRETLDANHPLTLSTAVGLARVYYLADDRFEEAESLLTEALDARRRILGEDHPDTLTTFSDMANVKWMQQQYDEAVELHATVLERRQKVLESTHTDVGRSMHNLAMLYAERGELDQAVNFFDRAQVILESRLGSGHPTVVRNALEHERVVAMLE